MAILVALNEVTIVLLFQGGSQVGTAKNQPAFYVFNNVKPDNCTVVEKNPDGFPSSLSDHDNSPDGDHLVIVTPVWVTLFTTTWT
jgi:hypothetical protein